MPSTAAAKRPQSDQNNKRKRRRRNIRTADVSSSDSSSDDSDSSSEEEEGVKVKTTKDLEGDEEMLDVAAVIEDDDEEEEMEEKEQKEQKERIMEKSGKIPSSLRQLHDPLSTQKFEEYYLQLLTSEFGDDLNAVRLSKDFGDKSLPMLVRSLKQGVNIFSMDEKRMAVNSGA